MRPLQQSPGAREVATASSALNLTQGITTQRIS